ncbi:hypothetical protein MFLAVUS_008850 [Mucor flavus]|uniref:Uncharacterized protein n=1 Tax=Mucor flavus TaxID=439312 RepID=A0ABP9Z8A9_9FUNG
MLAIETDIFLPHLVQIQEGSVYFRMYDAFNGNFLVKVKCPEGLYTVEGQRPRYAVVVGDLQQILIVRDYMGDVVDLLYTLNAIRLTVLPGEPLLPERLHNVAEPTMAPFQFTSGIKEGYYVVTMDSQENEFVPAVPPDEVEEEFDDELDIQEEGPFDEFNVQAGGRAEEEEEEKEREEKEVEEVVEEEQVEEQVEDIINVAESSTAAFVRGVSVGSSSVYTFLYAVIIYVEFNHKKEILSSPHITSSRTNSICMK